MNVLMYAWEYPPRISGGLGIACQGIVESLSRRGVRISLVLPEEFSGSSAYSSPLKHTKDYADLAGAMSVKHPHDIIHAHDWLTILAGIEAKKLSRKPLVFHIHALESDRSGKQVNKAIFEIEKLGMQQADRIIAVSHVTKQKIIKTYGISPEKVAVSYNGLTISLPYIVQAKPRSPITVLFLGRITYQKGLYYLIKAAQIIRAYRRDVEFIFAGDGDQYRDMVDEVARAQMGSYVHFTGFLSRENVYKVLSQSSIYVMPSVSEPFGISCLEAISVGVPVIISKNAGVCEVMPHVLKVDFWDTEEIASKILALLSYPVLGQTLIYQAKQRLTDLSWDNTTKSIMDVYRKLQPGIT